MTPPDLSDRVVEVRAYLTDDTFGYDHWRAAQFSAPGAHDTKPALLLIYDTKAERDATLARSMQEADVDIEMWRKRALAAETVCVAVADQLHTIYTLRRMASEALEARKNA